MGPPALFGVISPREASQLNLVVYAREVVERV
jgi:hypothetical protein